ncbi:MAG: hypothetical protein JXM70_00390 [Pirellulales bacterium]|nr:hypothetical protein [Pirellulales bacterium]
MSRLFLCVTVVVTVILISSARAELKTKVNTDKVKTPTRLKISAKAEWESPPPPLVVEVSIVGKQAAEATSYGRLKVSKATSADGVDMKLKQLMGYGPWNDPVKGYVKIDRKDIHFNEHPKDGVRIVLGFEHPKGNVTKTGWIEGSVELLTGGDRKIVEVRNLVSQFKKTVVDASLKAACVEIKPTCRENDEDTTPLHREGEQGKIISVQVTGKRENILELDLIDKSGKPINTTKMRFQEIGGPAIHSFMVPSADVGLRITVVIGSKTVVVPFVVSGVKIEPWKSRCR